MAKRANKEIHGFVERYFSSLTECEEVDLDHSYQIKGRRIRLKLNDFPLQLNIGKDGKKVLHIYPERPLNKKDSDLVENNFLIFDPDKFFKGVSGFIRVLPGEKLTLGRGYDELRDVLNLPQDIAKKQLTIINDKGTLILKSDENKNGSCVSPLVKEKHLNRVKRLRIATLKRIRSIYGGKLKALQQDEAMRVIRKVNDIMRNEPYHLEDSKGKPGGMVNLPAQVRPIIIGDLHAKIDNLLSVLSQNGFLKAMKKGNAALIILGDAVHSEEKESLEDMDSSILIMDFIFKLKLAFPKQVFYVRGNHDSYSEEVSKGGVSQGVLWERALLKKRGEKYRDEMKKFYNYLPFIVYSNKFIACHAGPPIRSTSYTELVDIHQHPKLMRQLINVRVQRNGKLDGYSSKDIKKFRNYLKLSSDTPVIVGHTPISNDGTLWEQVGDINEHYIVYGANDNWIGVMADVGEHLYPFIFPVEQLSSVINDLD